MKTIILSVLMILAISQTPFAQKQNMGLVNDIGRTLKQDNPRNPPEKVIHIIFAEFQKKHRLVKRTKTIDALLSDMIKLRRKYTASKEGSALEARAYDHAIAGLLSGSRPNTNNASCQGAIKEFKRALSRYDRALKAYQRCISSPSSGITNGIPTIDDAWGRPPSISSGEGAASANCQSILNDLKRAIGDMKRWGNIVKFACK